MIYTLECITDVLNAEQTQLLVKPIPMEICHFVDSHKIVLTSELTQTIIDNFISEQTPLLFNKFQDMENVPLEIRQQYTLN
jgi:hypothetical protein